MDYFEYGKLDSDVHFFCYCFLQFLFKKPVGQEFTRKDLKPVAFLVLPYKTVLHAFFLSFILSHWLPIINTISLQQHARKLEERGSGSNKNRTTFLF